MEKLISEVEKRSALWVQKHPHQKDRVIIDREWDTVAERTGFSKTEAKKKWRNLRDQFLKEFKKIPREKTGDPQAIIASYPGKWQYFGDLLFLKDAAMTRHMKYGSLMEALEEVHNNNNNNNSRTENEVSEDEDENSGGEKAAGGNSSTDSNTDAEVSQASLSEAKMLPSPPQSTTETPQSPFSSKAKTPRRTRKKRKKREENNNNNTEDERMVSEPEAKRPPLEAQEDEHSLFLRSLLPYFKRLGPVQQLRVRTRFQEVLLEAMTQSGNFNH